MLVFKSASLTDDELIGFARDPTCETLSFEFFRVVSSSVSLICSYRFLIPKCKEPLQPSSQGPSSRPVKGPPGVESRKGAPAQHASLATRQKAGILPAVAVL